MNNKNYPEGEKQAGRQAGRRLEHSQTWNSHDVRQRISTGLQTQGDYIGRQTRITRETQLDTIHTVIITWAMQNCKRPHHLSKQSNKTENTATNPSYRIIPDPSDSQLHVGASLLQFTTLFFYRVQVRELGWSLQKLVLSIPFVFIFWCVCELILMFVLDHCLKGRSSHGPL